MIKILPSDTLSFLSLDIYERGYLDSSYGAYYLEHFSLPPGNYELKIYLYDTSLTYIIDSAINSITIEGYDMANNLFPFDNSKICYDKIDSVRFSFGHFDPSTFKELQLIQIGASGKFAHTGTYFWRIQLMNCSSGGFTHRFDKTRLECKDNGKYFNIFCLCYIPYCKEQVWITYDCDGDGITGVPAEYSKPGCITDLMSDDCPCQWDVITIAD